MAELPREEGKLEIPVNGTIQQYKDFIGSTIWQDLKNHYLMWISDIRDQLELETDPIVYHQLQGNTFATRRAIILPEEILRELLEKLERKDTEDGSE